MHSASTCVSLGTFTCINLHSFGCLPWGLAMYAFVGLRASIHIHTHDSPIHLHIENMKVRDIKKTNC